MTTSVAAIRFDVVLGSTTEWAAALIGFSPCSAL
jgi:hypothetical protein